MWVVLQGLRSKCVKWICIKETEVINRFHILCIESGAVIRSEILPLLQRFYVIFLGMNLLFMSGFS